MAAIKDDYLLFVIVRVRCEIEKEEKSQSTSWVDRVAGKDAP